MRVRVIRQIFQLQFMIEKPRPDLLTLSTTFYDFSVSRNLFSKAKISQFGASGTERLRFNALKQFHFSASFSRLLSQRSQPRPLSSLWRPAGRIGDPSTNQRSACDFRNDHVFKRTFSRKDFTQSKR